MSGRPITVTGCPRSGTTWAGRIIGMHPKVFYLYEPFNDDARHNLGLKVRFPHIHAENEEHYRQRVDRVLALSGPGGRLLAAARSPRNLVAPRSDAMAVVAARRMVERPRIFLSAQRVLIKDPLAFFAAEWLADRYRSDVVVLLRNPVGFVSSYLLLGWRSELHRMDLSALPEPLRERGERLARTIGELDELDALIEQWLLFTEATLVMARLRRDWTFVLHDELCLAPVETFEHIFARLELPMTEAIRSAIVRETQAGSGGGAQDGPARQHAHERDSRALFEGQRKRVAPEIAARVEAATSDLYQEAKSLLSRKEGPLRMAG